MGRISTLTKLGTPALAVLAALGVTSGFAPVADAGALPTAAVAQPLRLGDGQVEDAAARLLGRQPAARAGDGTPLVVCSVGITDDASGLRLGLCYGVARDGAPPLPAGGWADLQAAVPELPVVQVRPAYRASSGLARRHSGQFSDRAWRGPAETAPEAAGRRP